MAYSSVAQLRSTLKQVTTGIMDDTKVGAQIDFADDELKTDLSGLIDFTLLPAYTDANFPKFINQLSRWKTCELCLVYSYSAKRETTQVDDISYWRDKYDDLIQRIRDGFISLTLVDGTSIIGTLSSTYEDPKANVKPYFGTGDYGTYQDDDDKEDDPERG